MPTIIGAIFFLCGLYCFLWREDSLFGLLIISSLFEAASAVNVAERGIQPYYLIAGFIIVRALVNRACGVRWNKLMPQGKWLLIFTIIAVASAFLLPIIFAGMPVYDPRIGVDEGLFIHPPLRFGLTNLAQAGFLLCHVVTAYALLAIDFSDAKTRKAYVVAFYLVVLVVFVQAACQFVGVEFPDSLIRNNPGYSLAGSGFLTNRDEESGHL